MAIARALANEPTLVLADEPTGNLDSGPPPEVLTLFQPLHRSGLTLVVVTHDAKIAAVADRVVAMRDGAFDIETRRAAHHGRTWQPLEGEGLTMGRALLIARLGLKDIRHRPAQSILLLVAIATGAAALTLALALGGTTDDPYERTRTATNGPDIVAEIGRS